MAGGGQGLLDMDGVFTEKERQLLLERLDSLSVWVGARIPERLNLEGRPVDLRNLLRNLASSKEPTAEELDLARRVEAALQAQEKTLKERLARGELSEQEAIMTYEETRGIIRALLKLRELGKDIEPYIVTAQKAKLADDKRWLKLLRSVGRMH